MRKVTLAMVDKWRGDLQTKGKPLQTIAIVTKAFHAALYRILEEDDDQPAKFKVEGGGSKYGNHEIHRYSWLS